MLREENEAGLLVQYLIAFLLHKILGRKNGDIFSTPVCPKDRK